MSRVTSHNPNPRPELDRTGGSRLSGLPGARPLLALLVAVAVVASACTDDGGGGAQAPEAPGPVTAATVYQATAAGGAWRVEGEAVSGEARGPVEGVLRADPDQGEVGFPVFVDGEPMPVRLLWTDGDVWVERAEGVAPPGDPMRSMLLRGPGTRPWVAHLDSPYAPLLRTPYDPFVVLRTLGEMPLEAAGEEQVDGREVTRYEVVAPAVGGSPGAPVTLWVDGDGVLARLATEQGGVAVDYVLRPAGDIPALTPPLADQVAEPGTELPVAFEPALTGPFEVVASGTDDGVTWRLERAPAEGRFVCWRFDSQPPLEARTDLVTATGLVCEPPLPEGAHFEVGVRFVVDADTAAAFEVLAAEVPPGAAEGEFLRSDGSTRTVPVEGGVLVYVGPVEPSIALLTLRFEDGRVLGCGPGSVVEPADLAGYLPEDYLLLRRLSWGCIEIMP